MLELDHLVVAASTLELGVKWTEQKLGVAMQAGGKHPLFGTHNALLKLGETSYLEVIAIDPDAPAPIRARWFALDTFAEEPKLIHWVARTDDIEARVLKFENLGRILEASRADLPFDPVSRQAFKISAGITKGATSQPSTLRATAISSAPSGEPCTPCVPCLLVAPKPMMVLHAIIEGRSACCAVSNA